MFDLLNNGPLNGVLNMLDIGGRSPGIRLSITPASGWVQSATYTAFAGTATHSKAGVTITAVEWKLESAGAYAAVDSFADGSWSVTSISLAEGANQIFVRATDSDGKTKEMSITVSVDTVDPVVDLGADTTHDGSGDTFTLTSSMWTEANPAMVEYQLDSGGYTAWASPYADVEITIPADESDHTIDLRVTDLSGRVGSDQVAINYSAGSLLLDTYTGAEVAYSVRLLDSDYTGALVKIRRSSDNAEKDFYPDSNNELSMSSEDGSGTSLSTWIGSDSGYVTTWYDQSGNSKDATNDTAEFQPQIINAGTINTVTGKPGLTFASTVKYLEVSSLSISQPFTAFMVSKFAANIGSFSFMLGNVSDDALYFGVNPSGQWTLGNPTLIYSSSYNQNTGIFSVLYSAGDSEARQNQSSIVSGNVGSSGISNLRIGTSQNKAYHAFGGDISEVILFGSDQSSNLSDIEDAVNSNYEVYA